MAHFVYVLESGADGQKYVGCTKDLKNRLNLHSEGRVESTKGRRPLKLIYYEMYIDQQDAYSREKFLKSGWGKNYLKKVLTNYSRLKKFGG